MFDKNYLLKKMSVEEYDKYQYLKDGINQTRGLPSLFIFLISLLVVVVNPVTVSHFNVAYVNFLVVLLHVLLLISLLDLFMMLKAVVIFTKFTKSMRRKYKKK